MGKIEPEFITGMGYIGASPGVLYRMTPAGKHLTAAGGSAVVINGAKDNAPLDRLTLHGKSTQGSTTGAQLFDKSKAFAGWVNSDGSINNAGTVGKGDNIVSEYIPFEAGKQYFCGSDFVWIYNTEKGFVKKADTELKGGVFTSPDNAGFFVVAFSVSAEKALAKSNEIMINVGSVKKPYEPYTGGAPSPSPSYPQEIESAGMDGEIDVEVLGKNLIPFKEIPTSTKNGITITTKSNGIVHFEGTATKAYDSPVISLQGVSLPKGRYRILEPRNDIKLYVVVKKWTGNNIWNYDIAEIEEGDELLYCYFTITDGAAVNADAYVYMQIDNGEILAESDFEPYKPAQKLIIPTPGGLPGIPVSSGGNYTDAEGQQWVCDEIDLAKGERVQWVKTVVLDGTESWEAQSGANYFSCQKQIDAKNDVPLHGLSPNIRVVNHAVIDSTQEQNVIAYTYFWRLRLADIDMQNGATVDDLKAFLSKNPITVYYASDVPIRTPLPPETIAAYKVLRTYSPTTTIVNDAGAGIKIGYKGKRG